MDMGTKQPFQNMAKFQWKGIVEYLYCNCLCYSRSELFSIYLAQLV